MLLDSNIIIYAATPKYNEKLLPILERPEASVSAITYVEVMGYHKLESENRKLLSRLFEQLIVLEISNEIVLQATSLREQRRLSLGDSIIAATALVERLTLVTHNTKDFEWIRDLSISDPMIESNSF